jgi:hypothetical protein
MKLLVLLSILSLPTFAAYEKPEEAYELTEEELNPGDNETLVTRKEKYLRDESVVSPINSSTGIRDIRRYTGLDRNRISASYHFNGQYEALQKLQGLEATWMRRSSSWHKLWYGATVRSTATEWSQITQNRDTGGEAAFQRPRDSAQTINTLGLGAGYRLKLFLDFFPMKDVFETVHVFGNYNMLTDDFTGENYAGYGMTAEYGLHKRTRTSFFYGGKFTYNISWVELGPDRNLSLGWYTFAFETGFHF